MLHSIEFIQKFINEEIDRQPFEGYPPMLYAPIAYTMHQGGKRMRPALTLLACEMFGGDIHKALYPAIGIEIFHNFTLVHDDIMDQAPLRRNRETVYKKWNTNVAILSGDTMFALAYDYLAKCEPELLARILPLFNRTAIEVCEGQQLDMEFETRHDVTIDEYIEMIRLKTAVLPATALKTGAILANAPDNDTDLIYTVGINVGLAFQLIDDVLDVYAEQDKFGKSIGNDILTQKKTFLYLKAIELANEHQRHELDTCFSQSDIPTDEKIHRVIQVYDRLNVKEEAYRLVDEYYKKAFNAFDAINVAKGAKSELEKFIKKLASRTF
ncbi:MAG: polyprenyl synthetase family protein [Bacteroidales bacterium]|jgi:geranylgeranyl diphosphate synthase type II